MKTIRLTTPRSALAILAVLPILLAAGWEQEPQAAAEDNLGFIYGRITTNDGEVYEGRLRWGGDEEAYWSEYFNGVKNENVWANHVAPEQLKESRPVEIFGFHLGTRERSIDLGRPFMARFGDLARIDTKRSTFQVTLKSGTVVEINRYASDDLADGVRVWDDSRGVVDIDEWAIRSIEFLPAARMNDAPNRLRGAVQTRQGQFQGYLQWNREKGVGADMLNGYAEDRQLSLPFDQIRSIESSGEQDARVTLLDDSEILLSRVQEASERGIYVNDPRYGRVLVPWGSFERVDFSPDGTGPSYEEFPPGLPLTGSVMTLSGQRLSGRLVFDLDESETTETLDAPSGTVDYSIPFGLVASIEPAVGEEMGLNPTRVTLHSGEILNLEASGDLSDSNGGSLIFIDGGANAEYVRWSEIERIDLDRPSLMYPSPAGR